MPAVRLWEAFGLEASGRGGFVVVFFLLLLGVFFGWFIRGGRALGWAVPPAHAGIHKQIRYLALVLMFGDK